VLDGDKWLKPGTNKTISMENIGPLENHVFTISADKNSSYYDSMQTHLLLGMKGKFEVVTNGANSSSIPGPSPKLHDSDSNGEI